MSILYCQIGIIQNLQHNFLNMGFNSPPNNIIKKHFWCEMASLVYQKCPSWQPEDKRAASKEVERKAPRVQLEKVICMPSMLCPSSNLINGSTCVSQPVMSRHTTLLRGLPAQLQDLAVPGEMDRAYYNHSWDLPVYIIDEKGLPGMDILQPPLWDLPVYIIVASLPFSPSGSHLVFNLQPVFSSPVMFHL